MTFFKDELTHNECKKSVEIVISLQQKKGKDQPKDLNLYWVGPGIGGEGCLETRSFKCFKQNTADCQLGKAEKTSGQIIYEPEKII